MKIDVGTIVLLPFPFTDLSTIKVRPALVINDVNVDDAIVVFISSKIPIDLAKTDFIISMSTSYYSETGLKKESVVKCEKIMTLSKSIILGEIGKLPQSVFNNEIIPKIKLALKLT